MPLKFPLVLSIVAAVFKNRADLVAENIALRHQLSCFIHRGSRPGLRPVDRAFWVLLSRFWVGWTESLVMLKPATVLAWHRQGEEAKLPSELFWRWKNRKRGPGRPRISVEACAFDLPGRFLIRDNDKIYGAYSKGRVDGLGLEQVRTAIRSPWQNGYAERWIGSLRRDCLGHVIAVNERQLRRVIRSYVDYYHEDRTHLGLEKDTPEGRSVYTVHPVSSR